MPTENVKNRLFKDVFNGEVQFEIPFFQRGYAWEKRQWDQLFQDIEEQIIAELETGSEIDKVEHFFGPVVVMEKMGNPEIREYLIIDGQQRLTTVYLLLGIVRNHLKLKTQLSSDASHYIVELTKYLSNEASTNDDYARLKLFSTKGDRLPTYRVLFGADANPNTPLLAGDIQAFVPGKSNVEDFWKYADKKLKANYAAVPALWQLAQALLRCLTVVWIPLNQDKDDSQAIFESLNDKGMQLTASELLCSFLFRPIIAAKENPDHLHQMFWLTPIKQLGGNDEFENYLRYLFSIGESKMVGKQRKVYVHFKSKHKTLTSDLAKHYLREIAAGAVQYRTIMHPATYPHHDQAITKVLLDISSTRMDSSTSFVLAVLKANAAKTITDAATLAMLQGVLVLLVRRKMAELTTTQYDVIFPQLFAKVAGEPDAVEAMQEQFKKAGVWVSDKEFQLAVASRPAYRVKDQSFTRMLLIELDKFFQSHGQLPDYTTVSTIEHILPQQLDDAWKEYLGSQAEDERLGELTQSIGNLCLLSQPANSFAGQDPFESKRVKYSKVTALVRNLDSVSGKWDLNAIRLRSTELAEAAVKVWAWA